VPSRLRAVAVDCACDVCGAVYDVSGLGDEEDDEEGFDDGFAGLGYQGGGLASAGAGIRPGGAMYSSAQRGAPADVFSFDLGSKADAPKGRPKRAYSDDEDDEFHADSDSSEERRRAKVRSRTSSALKKLSLEERVAARLQALKAEREARLQEPDSSMELSSPEPPPTRPAAPGVSPGLTSPGDASSSFDISADLNPSRQSELLAQARARAEARIREARAAQTATQSVPLEVEEEESEGEVLSPLEDQRAREEGEDDGDEDEGYEDDYEEDDNRHEDETGRSEEEDHESDQEEQRKARIRAMALAQLQGEPNPAPGDEETSLEVSPTHGVTFTAMRDAFLVPPKPAAPPRQATDSPASAAYTDDDFAPPLRASEESIPPFEPVRASEESIPPGPPREAVPRTPERPKSSLSTSPVNAAPEVRPNVVARDTEQPSAVVVAEKPVPSAEPPRRRSALDDGLVRTATSALLRSLEAARVIPTARELESGSWRIPRAESPPPPPPPEPKNPFAVSVRRAMEASWKQPEFQLEGKLSWDRHSEPPPTAAHDRSAPRPPVRHEQGTSPISLPPPSPRGNDHEGSAASMRALADDSGDRSGTAKLERALADVAAARAAAQEAADRAQDVAASSTSLRLQLERQSARAAVAESEAAALRSQVAQLRERAEMRTSWSLSRPTGPDSQEPLTSSTEWHTQARASVVSIPPPEPDERPHARTEPERPKPEPTRDERPQARTEPERPQPPPSSSRAHSVGADRPLPVARGGATADVAERVIQALRDALATVAGSSDSSSGASESLVRVALEAAAQAQKEAEAARATYELSLVPPKQEFLEESQRLRKELESETQLLVSREAWMSERARLKEALELAEARAREASRELEDQRRARKAAELRAEGVSQEGLDRDRVEASHLRDVFEEERSQFRREAESLRRRVQWLTQAREESDELQTEVHTLRERVREVSEEKAKLAARAEHLERQLATLSGQGSARGDKAREAQRVASLIASAPLPEEVQEQIRALERSLEAARESTRDAEQEGVARLRSLRMEHERTRIEWETKERHMQSEMDALRRRLRVKGLGHAIQDASDEVEDARQESKSNSFSQDASDEEVLLHRHDNDEEEDVESPRVRPRAAHKDDAVVEEQPRLSRGRPQSVRQARPSLLEQQMRERMQTLELQVQDMRDTIQEQSRLLRASATSKPAVPSLESDHSELETRLHAAEAAQARAEREAATATKIGDEMAAAVRELLRRNEQLSQNTSLSGPTDRVALLKRELEVAEARAVAREAALARAEEELARSRAAEVETVNQRWRSIVKSKDEQLRVLREQVSGLTQSVQAMIERSVSVSAAPVKASGRTRRG
jgi:DNA repair exonuclease SbcCD ATPase subunit